MNAFPSLYEERPAMLLTCSRAKGDAWCDRPATWHVVWTPDTENSLTCDEHMAETLSEWMFYDRHPITECCTMPGAKLRWSWVEAPGRCFWPIDDPALLACASATTRDGVHRA